MPRVPSRGTERFAVILVGLLAKTSHATCWATGLLALIFTLVLAPTHANGRPLKPSTPPHDGDTASDPSYLSPPPLDDHSGAERWDFQRWKAVKAPQSPAVKPVTPQKTTSVASRRRHPATMPTRRPSRTDRKFGVGLELGTAGILPNPGLVLTYQMAPWFEAAIMGDTACCLGQAFRDKSICAASWTGFPSIFLWNTASCLRLRQTGLLMTSPTAAQRWRLRVVLATGIRTHSSAQATSPVHGNGIYGRV